MNAADLLSELRKAGVRVEAKGYRLRIDAPAGVLTADRVKELRVWKARLLEALEVERQEAIRYDVPCGWTRTSWAQHLRHLAGICLFDARKRELTEWADSLEREGKR